VLTAALSWLGFSVLYTPPSCSDGRQNGDEEGVDCGGVCPQVCSFQAISPTVLWQRFFEVAPGIYSAVALIENANIGAEAAAVPYTFKLYDAGGILVYERKGSADIPSTHTFAVFETNIAVGERIPQRTFFEFTADPEWRRVEKEIPLLRTRGIVFEGAMTSPRLTATIENPTLSDVHIIEVIAVLFDESGNALGASRTVIDRLAGEGQVALVFTWPAPLERPVAKTVLYSQIDIE
jgi:hypothetical protein